MSRFWLRAVSAAALTLTAAVAVPVASITPPVVEATAPTAALCNGNAAFCGWTLHADNGSTDVLPSKAIGAHFGAGWSMPTGPNNSTGIGFCLDDTFGGVPTGPVSSLPLPSGWTAAGMRQAAFILTMYAGDRVVPYQPIAIDAAGELAGWTTRQRYLAVHLALLSVLPNYNTNGTYAALLDPATLQLYSDVAGTNPSSTQVVVPLVQQIVAAAQAHGAAGSGIVLTAEETSPGVVTVTATRDGNPVANLPIWPTTTTGLTYTGTTTGTAYTNAVLAGWPSLDYTTARPWGGVTNAAGQTTYAATAAALAAGVEFNTEEPPATVRQYGDGLNSQANLTWVASDIRRYSVPVAIASEFVLLSQVSDVSPAPGDTLTDALIVMDLADGVTMTAQIQLFDLTVDPTGSGTPLVDVTVPGLGNGTTPGLAPYELSLLQACHTIGYRHRAIALSDGSLVEPTPWSELGIPSETAVVQCLVEAEVHLRKTVSWVGGPGGVNAQSDAVPSYSPGVAPVDPSDGSHDDQVADAGDAVPAIADGTVVSFGYEVWLDEASTGVVTWPDAPAGVVTDDAGTPGEPSDDHVPTYVSGDDGDGFLEAGETWLYEWTSARTAVAGETYRNYSSIPSGSVHRPDNPGGPSEGSTTPREDPAGYVVPACSTSAVNPADGTNYVAPEGGTILDTVACTNLVVGEEITISGEAMVVSSGGVSPSGITGSTTVTPTSATQSFEVLFSIPAGADPGLFVVFEQVVSTSTGAVVARHEDPDDEAQMFRKRSPLRVTTQTCEKVVTAPKGAWSGLTCDRVTVYGDPGDVVTGSSTAYPWRNGARECGSPGATVTWTVTIPASGIGFVQTDMVAVPVGPDWEWIEAASTADGRQFMRDCLTSPRDEAESFVMKRGGGGGGDIPGTGADSLILLWLAGGLLAVGSALSLLVLRRRRPAVSA